MRVAALEAVGDQIPAVAAREGLDQQVVAAGQAGARRAAVRSHSCTGSGNRCQFAGSCSMRAHAVGEVGGERQPARRHRRAPSGRRRRPPRPRRRFAHAEEAQQAAGEHEGVAGAEHVDEIFLDLAEDRAEAALAGEPDLQQRRLDDGADVHARLAGDALVADVHPALAVAEQLSPAVVGGERVAAVLDEAQHVVEVARGSGRHRAAVGVTSAIDRRRGGTGRCRPGAGGAAPARRGRRVAAGRRPVRAPRRPGWPPRIPAPRSGWPAPGWRCDASSMRWLARPTRCSRRETPFGRADLDHLVDAAPVDAEVERGGGDHGAQAAGGHRGLDLAALLDFQAAVVQGDRQGRRRSASTAPGTSARPGRGC